jgi:hypothetical protein
VVNQSGGEMKRLFIIFTFSFFILNFFVPSLSFGAKKALLVGINDYQNLPFSLPGRGLISDLKGSLNDVKAMKEILIKRYGFPPDGPLMNGLLEDQGKGI